MGQAKQRGTFEDRKAQSRERRKAESAAEYARYQKREAERIARGEPPLEFPRRRVPLLMAAAMAAAVYW